MGYLKAKSLLIAGILLSTTLAVPSMSKAETTTKFKAVDKSAGVTYVVDENGSYKAIDLHGNSVIITAAEKYKDTASANSYRDIYIDLDRDGVIDDNESKVELQMGTSEDILAGIPVYGLYNASSTEPIRITQMGGSSGVVYGVYNGAIITTNSTEPACYLDIQGGSVNDLRGSYNDQNLEEMDADDLGSVIETAADTAVKIDIASNVSTYYGSYGKSYIKGTKNAVNVNLNKGGYVERGYGLYLLASGKGDVLININSEDKDSSAGGELTGIYYNAELDGDILINTKGSNVSSLKGIGGSSVSKGNVAISVEGSTHSSINAVTDSAEIEGRVDITVVDSIVSGSMYGITNGSTAGGDGKIVISKSTMSSFYGIANSSKLGGKLDITMTGSTGTSYMYGAESGPTIGGDLTFKIDSSKLNGMYTVNNGATINGNLVLDIAEDITYLSGNSFYVANNGVTVKGDVTAKIYGSNDSSIRPYWYGFSGYANGNVNIDYEEGYYYNVYGTNSSAYLDKNIVVTVNDADVYYQVYGFYGNKLDGSADIVLKNTRFGYFFGLQGCATYVNGSNEYPKAGGKVTIDVDNSNTWTGYSSIFGIQSMNAAEDVDVKLECKSPDYTYEDSRSFNTAYGIQNSTCYKDVIVTAKNFECSSFYGANNDNSYAILGNTTINADDIKVYYSAYGISNGNYEGTIDIAMTNIDIPDYQNASYSNNVYGVNSVNHIGGDTKVVIDNIKEKPYVYGVCLSNNGACEGNVDVSITNVDFTNSDYGSVYAASQGTYTKNVNAFIEDVKSVYPYGAYEATILGDATIKMNRVEAKRYSDPENSSNSIYGISNGRVVGKTDIDITNCDLAYTYVYPSNSTTFFGDVDILVDGVHTTADSIYGIYCDNSYGDTVPDNTINVTFKNVTVEDKIRYEGDTDHTQFNNYAYGNQKVIYNIDDETVDFGNVTIWPSHTSDFDGEAEIVYKGDIYYSGSSKNKTDLVYDKSKNTGYRNVSFMYSQAEIDHSISAENVYFCSGTPVVAKTATIKTGDEGFISNVNSKIVVEGNLKGNFKPDATSAADGDYCSGIFYMNGGDIETSTPDVITNKYYPLSITYDKKLASLALNDYIDTIKRRPDVYFAKINAVLSTTCTPIKGYMVSKASFKSESDDVAADLTLTNVDITNKIEKISFEMKEEPAAMEITVTGIQINAAKSVADPVVKLGAKFTAEAPLYDLASIKITNDSVEGTVGYQIDSSTSLPEGLKLDGTKIYGTTTKAYEDGKLVKVKITGKNGTSVYVNLNIIVTSGETNKPNTNTDGRLFDDEEKQIINLFGNSVVIEEQVVDDVTLTAIYMDDDRDGVKDSETPALAAKDLSKYSIYGNRDDQTETRPLKITMNSGKVKTIYGLYNSTITPADQKEDVLSIVHKGGTFSYIYFGTGTNTVHGDMYMESPVTSNVYTSGVNYAGYGYMWVNRKATRPSAYIYNIYTFKKDFSISDIYIYGTKTVIPRGVTVKAETYYYAGSSSVYVYNYGTLECPENITNYGYILMYDGSKAVGEVKENAETGNIEYEWNNVYYPVSFSLNRPKTSVTASTGVISVKNPETGVAEYFAKGGSTDKVNITNVLGYEYWYKLNGSDDVKSDTNIISFDMPRKASTMDVFYVSKDIELLKRFADPVAKVGVEYTATKPLYDYTAVEIVNDSTDEDPVTYNLKSGSKLPEGLELVDGKVIGTPTEAVASKTVSVIIKGHNGTTAEISVDYTVEDTETITTGLEKVEVSGSYIYLNGTSVVIYPASTNSSYSRIYADANHDGVADNNTPLTDSYGKTDFYNCSIFGYNNTDAPFDGDISIYTYGGSISRIYGAYGTYSKQAKVNGDVTVNVFGGTVNTEVATTYYADADNATLNIKNHYANDDTTVPYTTHVAYHSTISNDVNFSMAGRTVLQTNSTVYIYATEESTVGGDVNVDYGTYSNSYGFGSASTSYYRTFSYWGVNSTSVAGDVNYTVNGYMQGKTALALVSNDSVVDGTLNVDVHSGTIGCSSSNEYNRAFARDSKVNAIKVNVKPDTNANIAYSGSTMNVIENSTVGIVEVNIPKEANYSYLQMTGENAPGTVTVGGYINNRGALTVAGKYAISEDMDVTSFNVMEGSDVTILEDVTINNTGYSYLYGKLTNNGDYTATSTVIVYENASIVNNGKFKSNAYLTNNNIIDNYGEFSTAVSAGSNTFLTVNAKGKIINRENAVFNLGCRMNNSGIFANYGELNQTYSYSNYQYNLGKMYLASMPNFSRPQYLNYYFTSTNSQLYLPISLDYTDYCAKARLTDKDDNLLPSSGIEGDARQYIKNGETFYVQIDDIMPGLLVAGVTYNFDGTDKSASNQPVDGDTKVYYGTAGKNATVVEIEFGQNEADVITIAPSEGAVDEMTVGESGTFYNLGDVVKVSNDIDTAGTYVTYTISKSSKLPTGLTLNKTTGVISGTPEIASEEPQTTVINVTGKNQSVAQFALTFKKVNKGAPNVDAKNCYGYVGNKLSSVVLPTSKLGTYSWVDSDEEIGEVSGKKAFKAYFTPNTDALANYDWTKAVVGTWDADSGKLALDIAIQVYAINPTYTVPEYIEAYYNQNYADIDFSKYADENGSFAWGENLNGHLGKVGEEYHYIKYVPYDTDKYYTVNRIWVKFKILPLPVDTVETFNEVYAWAGDTLADVDLPKVEDGTYRWISLGSTVGEEGKTYKIGFVPSDTSNYDYTKVPGWSKAYKAVVFDVQLKLFEEGTSLDFNVTGLPIAITADHGSKLSDIKLPVRAFNTSNVHTWYVNDAVIEKPLDCGEGIPTGHFEWEDPTQVIKNSNEFKTTVKFIPNGSRYEEVDAVEVTIKVVGDHTWDKGVVTKDSTVTTTGIKTFTCTKCGETKTEDIPKKENTTQTPNQPTTQAPNQPTTQAGTEQPTTEVKPVDGVGSISADGKVLTDTDGVKYLVAEKMTNASLKKAVSVADKKSAGKYKITKVTKKGGKVTGGTVTYMKPYNKNCTSANIKASIKIAGATFKVTALNANAFKNCKKLTKVNIGSNISKIGKSAFQGCKKLKSVNIKTTKLKASSVGANAFKGISATAKVKVPKKSLKSYKKILKKKGINGKKQKITK